jgi:HK97 family phage portal protein
MNPTLDTFLQEVGILTKQVTPYDQKLLSGTTDFLGRTQPMGVMTGNAEASWLNVSTGTNLTSQGFAQHAIVYTIVSRIIEAAAPLPWGVYQVDGKGQRTLDPRHPLNALLDAPNPKQSWHDVLTALCGYLLVTGNAYLLKESPSGGINAGKPRTVRVLNAKTEVLGGDDEDEPVTGYREYKKNGKYVDHAPEDVLHLKYWNPNNAKYGLSPVAAGYKLVTAADSGLSSRVRAYQNQGPPGLLTKKGTGESWSDDQAPALQRWFSSFLRGGRNHGNIPITNGDVAWVSMGLSPVDLDVLEALHTDRDGIADLFAFPGHLLNGGKGTTFNNYGEAKRAMYSGCVVPLLQKIRSRVSPFLCAPYKDERVLNFDTSGVPELQANKKEQAEWLNQAWWVSTQRKQEIMGEEIDPTLPTYFIPSTQTAVLNPDDAAAQAAAEAAAVKRLEDAGIQDYK